MNSPEKQLKYSIRKVSVGAASVVIGALYLLMGAGIAHAEGVDSDKGAERTASSVEPERSGTGEPENKTDLSHTDAAANTYNAPVAENPLVAPESTKPRIRSKRELADGNTSNPSNGATGTESGDNQPTGEDSSLLDANRKGETVKEHQPGVIVPKDGEEGANDKNANLRFDVPKENLTAEELWDIVKNMPDDFQNNERSYLRNMNTLGDALNLKPGEIRELHDFGGWSAIDKEGTKGKFVIGRKNEQGYFTGWYKKEDGTIEQGGMLGGDALDNIYVHEQALDRRFRYMLMLVKGRTRANRNEKVSDNSDYDPRAQNERANKNSTEFKNLPFLEKDNYNKYSPGVVGYNGIEKQFTAFSPALGSRVRVEFVTGYISDINGSKGTYRVVIKAQNSKGEETKVYDETISRVAEIVQNEELYKKGLNVEAAHANILKFLKDEFNYRANKIRDAKIKNSSLKGISKNKYNSEQEKLYDQIVEEATEEAKKQGDIVMNVTEEFLSIAKSKEKDSEWKKTFTNTSQSTIKLSNDLNNLLKNADKDTPNTPTWLSSGSSQAKADDRAYRLLTTLIPGAKKITYHVKDDQLEVETDKYTYTAARNGSKEVGIQGSDIAATLSADAYNANPQTFDSENTNTKANNRNNGWARSGSEEFKNFSHFIGVDKGIERTNVISDKDLSDKIRAALGPGDSKLGKGGYFSTGDVLLGKDIVSYTVQVFSGDDNRVGVNPQSHRVQYNLPILADFSVIQDTVEPSRSVVEKIIPKLNIPPAEKDKITEEIKKKKKTSELAELISGSVKVRYVDEQGNLLSLKNDTGIGEKESDGTYITNKKQLIGTSYNVTDKKLSTISTTNGKHYRAKRDLGENSDPTEGNIVNGVRTITYVYEEREAPTTATVTANYYKEGTQEKLAESVIQADLAIGSQYTTEAKTIEGKTTTEDKEDRVITRKTTYTLVATPENATGTVPEDGATVNYYRENVEETVVPKTEDVKETKTVTRTIKYVDATDETREVADSVTQTVTLTRTNKRNKVTGVVTEGNWSTGTWASQASPTVTNYDAPDKATVAETTVTSTTTDTTEVVKYPQATEDVVETKTITRTIKYVDATDETTEVASPVTQTVELTRTNKRNKVTKVVTEGTWTTGNWDEKTSPSVENYGPAETATVSSATVTSASTDETVVVKYPQAIEDVQESKTVTRTIKYVDKENEATEVATPVTQTVTLTRTNKRNKVTKVVTEGTWTTGNWDEKASPSVENYGPAETATVSSATVTSASTDETVVVKYPQAIEDVQESKTVTRTIKYVDKENEATEVATPVTQTVELTRTNKRNKVTGEVTEGDWSTGTWSSQTSPTVTNYDAPDKATVAEETVTSTTDNTTVVVKYPQSIADEIERKTVTRTIKYVDKANETKEVADLVTQTVELTRTNKRNKVTGKVTEGDWSTGTWGSQTSPKVTNYDAPDTESVAEATVTSTTDNTTVVVKYPQAIEDVKETKTVTRTIKYVDKENEATEVATPVTQTVTLTRTNKRNKVTKVVTEGTWTTGNWDEKASPSVENYGPAETATVSSATVTSASTDETVVVKYPQAIEDVQESKTVTRTIKYVDKENEATEVASPVTQTVELTRTNKRNKVTGKVTEGDWSTGNWEAKASPSVENYDTPDKATVAEATVTSTTTDTTEVVKYPQAIEDVKETKTVTRTIKYVDKANETKEVADSVTQTVELTRTNKRNKVTGKVTEGDWSTGNWEAKASPSVENYDAPDKATVAEETVTSTTDNTTVVVKYPQSIADEIERKTVTRTIKYVDATDETTEVASPVTQTVELTRTNKRNKVTGKVTEGDWSTGNWDEKTSPSVENYDAPDKATVAEATVTSTTTDTTEVVKYPQATEDVTETKTITRTIKYVDATDETREVADSVTQTVTLTRTNKRNKVTGVVTEGNWSTGTWGSQTSPTVTNYDAPDKATVAEATVTSTTTDTTEVVKYPQATEDVVENKTITRTIKYVDATDETTEVASPVTQTVELTRTNKRNKVTGKVTEGDWSTGNWDEKTSPSVENYDAPDKATVAEATVTSTTDNMTVVVKYPQSIADEIERKTVTRTIKYVDATDETTEVATPVTQTVELTRTNKRNKVTGEVTEGDWSTGTWGSQTSPTVTNYDAPDKATVAEATVTSTTTDTTEVVKYPQATEDVVENKTITRTIKYVDATDETREVADSVTQTVTLTRTNKRNKVTGVVTEGNWSTGTWGSQTSPTVTNYDAPDKATVAEATVTSTTTDTTEVVKYPQATEDVVENKTITRTIKYVDATDETREVADSVTQTVTLTRTNKRNKVTGVVTEGNWSTGTWGSQTSPTVTNYDAPDKATVAEATVTSTTTDTTEVVKYPQATEDVTETKTITRTIKYVDATDETTEVARPVTQTVELTRTNKRNKVTGKVTEGDWSTGTWATQVSPTVTNYDTPDTESVAEATVTSTTANTTVVVKYPQAIEDVKETKTVTRTIKYVDKANETREVADSVTQTVELTRTNKRNKVTGKVTEGDWSTGNWGSQTSPKVTNYDAPDKATVAEATVTSTTTDTTEVVKYPQATEDVKETKTITRTIKYVDATDETTEVSSPVTQTVELTRTNKRNKVTGKVTEGDWSTGTWGSQTSPKVTNYDAPDKATVAEATVTSTTTDTTEVVKYPQATEDVVENKTITRTIKYVDATDETREVADSVTQTVTLTRTNKRNKVTGVVTEGNWSTGTWGSQTSPTVTNYDAPDKATVAEATVTSTTTDTTEVVKYPQATEDVVENKTITRTIKYVDATDETREVADSVTQTVTLTRTNKRNKVTGVVTEGNWSTGTWGSQTSPTVTNYDAPDKATVAEATVTSTTTDTTEVVKYPQATEDVTETKTITRTIKYVDATDETTEVARPVTQTVELTRTNKRNKVTGKVTEGDWSTGTWATQVSPTVTNYDTPDTESVAEATVTSTTANTTVVVKYPQAIEDVKETKTVTRTIKYVDKANETREVADSVTQTVELTRTNKRNKVTGKVTEGDWSTGTWEEVVSPEIANYGKPDLPKVSNEEVTSNSKDTTILIRYDRLSTPDKPTPEKPEIPSPQEPGTPDVPNPDKPTPQPNPEHPSVPTPIPEPTPEPDTPRPETPVNPDSEVPTYETGKREVRERSLPNTGTKANATLASAGIMTLLAGLGLGFFKKKEDEK